MSKIHILPNLRKGLSKKISSDLIKEGDIRPSFKLDLELNVSKADNGGEDLVWDKYEKPDPKVFTRDFFLTAPVDIQAIDGSAISQVVPADKSTGYSNGYMPFMEFYDEDFPWRYTPVESSSNLKPWLMLLACKNGEFTTHIDELGRRRVELLLNDEQTYSDIFPSIDKFHLLAHVHVTSPDSVKDPVEYVQKNPDDGVSRLFCSRPLETFTFYTVFLVPAFELGRRSGLGLKDKLETVGLDTLSWESSLAGQEEKHPQPLTFPIYYQWSFASGSKKFLDLAKQQFFTSDKDFDALKSVLKVDISDTGLQKIRYDKNADLDTPIDVPAALVKPGFEEETLVSEPPAMDQELKTDFLIKSPVFSENREAENGGVSFPLDEDPWVVPPVYGARHRMASEKDLDGDTFLNELNLRFRNRAAAGMGVSVVKKNQDMFMNRAWGMVDEINKLNQRIRELYQLVKANGAADKKVTELRQYQFNKGSLSGIQADAAIRIANAQKSGDVNAVDLASDIANDRLIVENAVMGDFKRKAGIRKDELEAISDMSLWEDSWKAVLQANKKYCLSHLTAPFFSLVDQKYAFLGTAFHLTKDFALKTKFNDETKKLEFVKRDPGEEIRYSDEWYSSNSPYMTIEQRNQYLIKAATLAKESNLHTKNFVCNNVYHYLASGITTYMGVKDSAAIFEWLDDTDVFQYLKERRSINPLQSFVKTLEYSKKEFEGKTGDNLGFDYGKLKNMILPIEAGSGSIYLRDIPTDLVVLMKEKAYQDRLSDYPEGVYIPFSNKGWLQNKYIGSYEGYVDHTLYILPESYLDRYACSSTKVVVCQYLDPDEKKFMSIRQEISVQKDKEGHYRPSGEKGVRLKDVIIKPGKTHLGKCGRYNSLVYLISQWPQITEKKLNLEKTDKGWNQKSLSFIGGRDVITFKVNETYQMWVMQCDLKSINRKEDIYFKFDGKNFIKRVDRLSINLAEVFNLMNSAKALLEWYDGIAWYPTYINWFSSESRLASQLSPSKIAGYDFGQELLDEINDSAQPILDRISSFKSELAENDILGVLPPKEEEWTNGVIQIPTIDPKEQSDNRLREITGQFATSGMSLDLLESNFDGKYPIMAFPIFPDPASFYLQQLSTRFILPSVDQLQMNSISCFVTNPAFEEAFLAGMNTEMGRELLWREYPTDERGSYFMKFWDQSVLPKDFGKDFFDVKFLHQWDGKLGKNHAEGKGPMLIFIIKSELMVMYPQTVVSLVARKNGEVTGQELPAMTGWLTKDTYMAGFTLSSNIKQKGDVYLAFTESDKSLRFSFDKLNMPGFEQIDDLAISSDYAKVRSDNGSIWGIQVNPIKLTTN